MLRLVLFCVLCKEKMAKYIIVIILIIKPIPNRFCFIRKSCPFEFFFSSLVYFDFPSDDLLCNENHLSTQKLCRELLPLINEKKNLIKTTTCWFTSASDATTVPPD